MGVCEGQVVFLVFIIPAVRLEDIHPVRAGVKSCAIPVGYGIPCMCLLRVRRKYIGFVSKGGIVAKLSCQLHGRGWPQR
jgi:hypothetical protein